MNWSDRFVLIYNVYRKTRTWLLACRVLQPIERRVGTTIATEMKEATV